MGSRILCPDCNRDMEEGFLLDSTHSGHTVGYWVGGQAERSIWTGLKMKGRQKLPILAMRCPRCGLLRLYAQQEE